MPMGELVAKAQTLHEALPYIRRFHGEIFVIKYGGHAMLDRELRHSFAKDIVLMKYVGLSPVVVHGGGPQIDEALSKMGVKSERIDGLRITDEPTMDVVEMVLGGKVNQEIVSLICSHGGRAVGLSGQDDAFMRAEPLGAMTTKAGIQVDPGRVGRIVHINPEVVRKLVDGGFIPVIAPVGVDREGRSLNINADTVAGDVAEALRAKKLVLMTDAEGVWDKDKKVISSLSAKDAERLTKEGVIDGGMIPKVECAVPMLAASKGAKAHIIDGRIQHAVLLELFTDHGIGTEITP